MSRFRPLRVYGVLFRRRPARTLFVGLLALISCLSEGLALVVLIPLISGVSGDGFGADNRASELLVSGLKAVGIRPTLLTVIGVFAVLAALSSVSVFLTTVVSKRLMNDAEAELRSELFDDVFSMRWSSLAAAQTAQLTKVFLQATQFGAYGFYYLMFGATMAIAALIYLAFSMLLSPSMTLMTLAFGVVVTPVFLTLSSHGKRSASRASHAFERLTAHLHDGVANAKFVLAQHLQPFVGDKFHVEVDSYRIERNRNDAQAAGIRMGFELAAVVFVAAYLYVSLHVLDQPIAVALVFLAVFYRLGPKILGVQENLFRALSNATWLEDCVALAETAQRAVDPTTGTRSPTFSERLEVRELTFAHAGALEPLLRDVSMDLGPRECVAVVGPSGQGKSTLLDVIIGLHQPSSGLVMLDGVDLREVDLRAWRRRVGFVLQDSPIFNATIRDNIVLDRVPLAPDRFDKVCEQAGVTEFVRRMPQGHDTIVGERGSQISGGQRQRIALARALYREPWLLVLDEATSSLDAATEGLILERLGQLKGELAMLIVSHGERVLRLADRVYNVDHGRVEVVEQHGARG